MIEGKFYQRNASDLLEVLGVTDEVLSQLSAFPGKLEHAQNGRTVARNSNSLNTYSVLTYYSIYMLNMSALLKQAIRLVVRRGE